MAENVPPPDNTTRGVPYYEKLKRDLRETLKKKLELDKNMVLSPFPPFRLILSTRQDVLTLPSLPS